MPCQMAAFINMYFFTLIHGSLLSLLLEVCFLENYFEANQLQEIPPKWKRNEENVMTLTSNGSIGLKINMILSNGFSLVQTFF